MITQIPTKYCAQVFEKNGLWGKMGQIALCRSFGGPPTLAKHGTKLLLQILTILPRFFYRYGIVIVSLWYRYGIVIVSRIP